MSHMRRIAMPKSFPIKKKGRDKYVVFSIGNEKSIPLLLILRDILKIVKTRKEAVTVLRSGEIMVNSKKVLDERLAVHIFDNLSIPKLKQHYRMILKNDKFAAESISEKESTHRICKIIGKKVLQKGKIQLNLDNGYNLLSDAKAAVNDSIILDLKNNKIMQHLPLKEKVKIRVIGGSHTGEEGMITEIKDRMVGIKTKEGDTVLHVKNVQVIENEK